VPRPTSTTQPIVLQTRVPASAAGQTLLAFLQQRFRYRDEQGWRDELAAGRLQLDGERAEGAEALRTGMRLRYEKLHREPPVDDRYTILCEDDALVVVDKPAHLPMHADGPFIRNTLISLLRERRDEPSLQLLHRLDRETSGVCLVARSKQVQAAVQEQFCDGRVQKHYVAVVRGHVAEPFVADEPIGHRRGSAIKLRRSAHADAIDTQPARTEFTPLEHGDRCTLLRCTPQTGRTHQIRAHLEAHGHPVLGDKIYGHDDGHYLAFVRRMKAGASVFDEGDGGPHRHLLHAHQIELQHPLTDAQQRYEAPIPADFSRWLLS